MSAIINNIKGLRGEKLKVAGISATFSRLAPLIDEISKLVIGRMKKKNLQRALPHHHCLPVTDLLPAVKRRSRCLMPMMSNT
jgi:hypothetical protein